VTNGALTAAPKVAHVVLGHGHALKVVDQGVQQLQVPVPFFESIVVLSLIHIYSINNSYLFFFFTIPILPAGFMREMLVDFLRSQEQLSVLFYLIYCIYNGYFLDVQQYLAFSRSTFFISKPLNLFYVQSFGVQSFDVQSFEIQSLDGSVVGRSVVGRSVVGHSVVGRSVVHRSVVRRSVVRYSVIRRPVVRHSVL
jgi:hypothetical protein